MKRLAVLAAFAFLAMPMATVSAAPVSTTQALLAGAGDDVVEVKGGRGRGHGGHHMRGGRGHHYGWGRGHGRHYGWSRGRHRGW